MDRTEPKIDKPLPNGCSRPVQFEVVGWNGAIYGPYPSAGDAVRAAQERWPHQAQDEDRTGAGWDLQVAGCVR